MYIFQLLVLIFSVFNLLKLQILILVNLIMDFLIIQYFKNFMF